MKNILKNLLPFICGGIIFISILIIGCALLITPILFMHQLGFSDAVSILSGFLFIVFILGGMIDFDE